MSELPNGKPLSSEKLPDGRTRHLLADGRRVTVTPQPLYRLEYLSSWVGAEPGDTYDVRINVAGPSVVDGFYEAWNYDINELRSYRFDKTMRLVDLATGEVFLADQIRNTIFPTPEGTPTARCVAVADTETTGLDWNDEPVSVGLILVEVDEHGALIKELDRYHGLREPAVPIHPDAQRVHGLSLDQLRGRRCDVERVDSILARAQVVVAHNAAFDARMLAKVSTQRPEWRCSLEQFPWIAVHGKSLDGVCRTLGVPRASPHNALTDCEALLAALVRPAGANGTGRTFLGALLAEPPYAVDYPAPTAAPVPVEDAGPVHTTEPAPQRQRSRFGQFVRRVFTDW